MPNQRRRECAYILKRINEHRVPLAEPFAEVVNGQWPRMFDDIDEIFGVEQDLHAFDCKRAQEFPDFSLRRSATVSQVLGAKHEVQKVDAVIGHHLLRERKLKKMRSRSAGADESALRKVLKYLLEKFLLL